MSRPHEPEAVGHSRSGGRLYMSEIRQEAIEALPMPIFFMDTTGRYSGVNTAWEAFFGIDRENVIGKSARELFPEHEELHVWTQAPAGTPPSSETFETAIRSSDGMLRDVVFYKATYAASDQSVRGVIGTIIDVTERRRADKRQAMEHAITRVL